jgi:hypothetical protein
MSTETQARESIVYDSDLLNQIARLIEGLSKAEENTGPLYFHSPIEIRSEDSTYGYAVSQDGLWGLQPHPDGPHDIDQGT